MNGLLGVAGIMIDSDYGIMNHSRKFPAFSTRKKTIIFAGFRWIWTKDEKNAIISLGFWRDVQSRFFLGFRWNIYKTYVC